VPGKDPAHAAIPLCTYSQLSFINGIINPVKPPKAYLKGKTSRISKVCLS